jgi:hypothetical protein
MKPQDVAGYTTLRDVIRAAISELDSGKSLAEVRAWLVESGLDLPTINLVMRQVEASRQFRRG